MGKTKLNAVTQALVHIDPDKHPLFIRLKKSGDFVWLEKADVNLLKSLNGLGLLCIVDDPNMFKETLDMAVLAPEIKKLFEGTLAAACLRRPPSAENLPHIWASADCRPSRSTAAAKCWAPSRVCAPGANTRANSSRF